MKNVFWLTVLLGGGIMFLVESAESASADDRLVQKRRDSWDRVQEYLSSSRHFRDYTIRLYYRADCGPADGDPNRVRFPLVKVEAPANGETGLAAARHIFKNVGNVRMREDPGRIIRIWIGDVPTAILRTRISVVKLDKGARATKVGAVEAILETKEVLAAKKFLKMDTQGYVSSESAITPPPYPAKIKNVTFDQALDVIAKAWDGIVTYGACATPDESGTRLFDIEGGIRTPLIEH